MSGSFLTSGLPPTPGASGASPSPWVTPQACWGVVQPGKPRPEGLSSSLLSRWEQFLSGHSRAEQQCRW